MTRLRQPLSPQCPRLPGESRMVTLTKRLQDKEERNAGARTHSSDYWSHECALRFVVVEPLFEVINANADADTPFASHRRVDIAIAMRKPVVKGLEHFLSPCFSDGLKGLR